MQYILARLRDGHNRLAAPTLQRHPVALCESNPAPRCRRSCVHTVLYCTSVRACARGGGCAGASWWCWWTTPPLDVWLPYCPCLDGIASCVSLADKQAPVSNMSSAGVELGSFEMSLSSGEHLTDGEIYYYTVQ